MKQQYTLCIMMLCIATCAMRGSALADKCKIIFDFMDKDNRGSLNQKEAEALYRNIGASSEDVSGTCY